jgi:hypothetical protein
METLVLLFYRNELGPLRGRLRRVGKALVDIDLAQPLLGELAFERDPFLF